MSGDIPNKLFTITEINELQLYYMSIGVTTEIKRNYGMKPTESKAYILEVLETVRGTDEREYQKGKLLSRPRKFNPKK